MKDIVLITGATGFVGSQVLKAFKETKTQFRLLVRKDSQRKKDLPKNAEIVETADLFCETDEWWKENLKGVDTVLHLAWYAEPGKYLHSERNLFCLEGTIRLGRVCAEVGVRRLIGVGTCFEYDLSHGMVDTNTPLLPASLYAACKVSAYQALQQFCNLHEIEFLWCRLFYIYGEGEDCRRLVPYLRSKLEAGEPAELTSGRQVRDFMNVYEVAHQLVQAVNSKEQGTQNICSGKPISVRELAEQIADEYGRRDLLKFGTRPENLLDPPYVVGVK